MNKKIIALLLAVFMLFTSSISNITYAVEASLDEDEAYAKALSLIEALGTKAFSNMDRSVTYNSFNDALSVILSGDNISYDISELTGITFSSSAGNEILTYNDAVRSLVNLLGYKVKADANGGSMAAYMGLANNLDILDDVNINNKEYITARDAAVMIANALDTDMLQIETLGTKIDYKTVKGETLLYVYRDIKFDEGVVEANEFTDFFSAGGVGENRIKINGNVYYDPNNKAVDMLGYAVKYYYIEHGGSKADEIISASKDNALNNTLVIDGNFIGNDGRKIYYKNNYGKEKNTTIPGRAPVIYNNTALSSYDNSVFNFTGKYAELVDNNADNTIDVVIIKEAQDIFVEGIDTTIMTIHDKIGIRIINLSDSGKFDRVRIFDEDKASVNIYALNKGDILSAYINKEGNLFDAYISKKQIKGKITELEEKSNGEIVAVIADEEYFFEKNFYDREKDNLILGASGLFYINANGKITYAVYAEGGLSYAYLMDIDYTDGPKSPIAGKILLSDGNFSPLTLKERVKIDNKLYTNSKEALEALKKAVETAKTGVIRYDTDDNGLVYVVDTAYRSAYEGENTLFSFGEMRSAYYNAASTLFPAKFRVDTNKTILFFAPSDENLQSDEHYGVGSFSHLQSSINHTVQGFGTDPKNLVPDVVVCDEDIICTEDIKSSSKSYIFKDKIRVLDENGDETYKITYFQAYNQKDTLCYNDKVLDGLDLECGDVFVGVLDNKGKFSKIRKIYDAKTGVLDLQYYIDNNISTTNFASYNFHYAGYVYYVSPSTVSSSGYVIGISSVDPLTLNGNTEGKVSWFKITNTSGIVVDYSYLEEDIRHTRRLDPIEIKDYIRYGNDCAKAYIRVDNNSTVGFAVYQK